MSVSRGSRANEYSEFTVQHVQTRFNWDVNDRDSGLVFGAFEDAQPVEIAGGDISPDEVAELVYWWAEAELLHESGDAENANAPGTSNVQVEIGRNSSPELIDVQNSEDVNTGGFRDTATSHDDDGVLTARIAEDLSSDIVDHFQVACSATFDNGTSGAGGGGFTSEHRSEREYRQLFGKGPVFWHNDELHHHLHWNVDSIDSGDIELEIDYTAVWDITER